ncbi:MAG: nucleotidyltransferase domain-containing protein [Bdellovibrionota bacterium]
MKFGIPDRTILKIRKVFEKYPEIDSAIIYGSRAKGNYREGSDIDLTLLGSGINLTVLNKISNELDDLLLPYLIDLSSYSQIANLDLLDHIKRVGLKFYEKEPHI